MVRSGFIWFSCKYLFKWLYESRDILMMNLLALKKQKTNSNLKTDILIRKLVFQYTQLKLYKIYNYRYFVYFPFDV